MLNIIICIFALGLIIVIHEFGHFLVARLFKVAVVEFSVGMGPRLLSIVKGKVRYSLCAVPFGGSCMMLGEELDESEEAGSKVNAVLNGKNVDNVSSVDKDTITVDGRTYDKSEQMVNKAPWKKILILLAGPFFNFFLAFILALFVTGFSGFDFARVEEVTEGMPIAEAGIEVGDTITGLSFDEEGFNSRGKLTKIDSARDLQMFMMVNDDKMQEGRQIVVRYKDVSDGESIKTALIKPQKDEENGRMRLGFSYALYYDKVNGPINIIKYSYINVKDTIKSAVYSVKMLLSGKVGRDDVSGPVGMVAMMGDNLKEAGNYGIGVALLSLIDMIVLISGSIGAMNLLPIPALDGGRIVFALIELVTGKSVPKKAEVIINGAGMILLLALMFFVMFNDIFKLIIGH